MRLRFLIACIVFTATALSAQTFRGTILGTVTDPSGAVVSGASVTVRNLNTGLERTTQTSADGSYSVPELPVGTYSVTVTLSGFQTSLTNDVAVDVASERRVDAALKTGQVSDKVEVSGEALPQVDTSSAELGGTLTSETIANIPVNGRDYTKLIYLNPGVAGSPDQISDSPGSFGTFSMNGSRGRSNNFLLDGTDMNDGYRNDPAINEAGVFGDPATILPIDAVAELRVLSNYEAEYGRNSGAVVNIVTKSGTNQWHGSGLEFVRTGQFGARNYFNIDPNPKSPFHNNQFGGSLGGPVVKDKTFFYADYEGQRETGAQSGTTCVPDPAAVASAEASIAAWGESVSPVTTALLSKWPSPNAGGCNLSINTNFSNRVDSVIAKLDHNFNPNNMFTGRYYFGDSFQSFPFAQLAAGLLPGFNTVTPTRVQLISLSYVKVVNPSQVNEARLGWNRFAEGFFPQDSAFSPASVGLDTGVGHPDYGLPTISVSGFSPIGAAHSIPRNRVDSNWHFIDNYSWKSGRHDVKFGYEFRRTTIMQVDDFNFRGTLAFSGVSDPNPLNTTGALDPLESFLEGLPSSGSQASGDTKRHTHQNNHSLYVQDSFRITQRLTLNFGTRWDYFGVIGEKNNLLYRFNSAAGGSVEQIGTSGGPSSLYAADHNNFAPRLAFAYDVTGKGQTVIRGGWGIFYDAFSQDMFIGHAPWNCAFCPGPAYTGTGAAAISTSSLSGSAIAAGQPVFSGASPLGDFFATDPNLRTPYVQNFNLNLQHEIGKSAVAQIGYVGARGTDLFRFRDINQPGQSAITAADLACNCISGVPRPYSKFFYLNQEESKASSTYHALQASLHLSAWHGISSQANFVWSHSIDDASDSEDFIPNQAQPQDSTNPNLNRGNSSFDIRRRFTWNFSYRLPKFDGSLQKVRNGWGLDGVVSLQDGQPWELNYNFEGDYSGAGEGFDRPDVVGPAHYSSNPAQYLDLSSFAAPCTFGNPANDGTSDQSNCIPGTRHFGSLGRNSLRAPGFREFNFSLFKETPISERINLEIRAEFFNILNHPNFSNPTLPNFIADAGSPGPTGRQQGFYSLTATGDVGIGNPFLGGGGPRGIQFSAKVSF